MACVDTGLKQQIALIPMNSMRLSQLSILTKNSLFVTLGPVPRHADWLDLLQIKPPGYPDNLKAQGNMLYRLGMKRTVKTTSARVNAEQPAAHCQTLFTRLLNLGRVVAPKLRFSFMGYLNLLDGIVINFFLAVFPLIDFPQKKASSNCACRSGCRRLPTGLRGHDQGQGAPGQLGEGTEAPQRVLLCRYGSRLHRLPVVQRFDHQRCFLCFEAEKQCRCPIHTQADWPKEPCCYQQSNYPVQRRGAAVALGRIR